MYIMTPHTIPNTPADSVINLIPAINSTAIINGEALTATVTPGGKALMEALIFLQTASFSSCERSRFLSDSPIQSHA